ncbi:heat shock factor-binding protein 1-like [Oppia nitens]|uniref:heat shock factor-binding protein 1-like n=1 Tax=Oppia nitens TaxID=1686743 RepID=UPI0023DCC59C|nr:heat shock factor-binding protein 1-like [Oppia nitens]
MDNKTSCNTNNAIDTKEAKDVVQFVQTLLQSVEDKFQQMSDQILSRIDEMGHRIDDLEHNLNELVAQSDTNSGIGGEDNVNTNHIINSNAQQINK